MLHSKFPLIIYFIHSSVYMPGGGHGTHSSLLCLEKSRGQRSLAAYSSWGHGDSDTTEGQARHIGHACPSQPSSSMGSRRLGHDRGTGTAHRACMSSQPPSLCPPPLVSICSLGLCLYFCFENKFICTSFVDSI